MSTDYTLHTCYTDGLHQLDGENISGKQGRREKENGSVGAGINRILNSVDLVSAPGIIHWILKTFSCTGMCPVEEPKG